ncbi:tRNA dihydrouridine synthase [Pseudothauera hydrothermalis]|uniref:tRNA dihydrouridine synthase n=1 Tax=Pseudothauera hydrothermalis TaxID=2184083 RepID=UPI001967AB40|nr:tRNA-dihydrouridine synthase [Pseudothauera hydrothermalis]
MRLLLAPMEGLLDFPLRDILTRVGGYDHAVTEFARVSGTVLPRRYFHRISPELVSAGRTAAGTPVRVQLLGSEPARMADSAAVLVALGPAGVDLNFGCPAPTVNRHRGGAVLLDEPELLYRIAAAVRAVVPRGMPFSAKMRLGVRDTRRALECAQALVEGGVDELVVHARTKAEGYRPPAHWEWVGRIADVVPVPVAANGEIWCEADWRRCCAVSGTDDVMLGRGAVADPFLARRIRQAIPDEVATDPTWREQEWDELRPLLAHFWQLVRMRVAARHAPGRLKQWLGLLRRNYLPAQRLFDEIRLLRLPQEVDLVLVRHRIFPTPKALAA